MPPMNRAAGVFLISRCVDYTRRIEGPPDPSDVQLRTSTIALTSKRLGMPSYRLL